VIVAEDRSTGVASANGISLEYQAPGIGEPVIFIHGVLIAGIFRPVVQEPALGAFRCVTYARRG